MQTRPLLLLASRRDSMCVYLLLNYTVCRLKTVPTVPPLTCLVVCGELVNSLEVFAGLTQDGISQWSLSTLPASRFSLSLGITSQEGLPLLLAPICHPGNP
ncbi:hypothetical protein CHARACLAT_011456 [Characodon lateralis]|uniref:Uncharacterized protein n=1 Tax=Characodon lateralis TaxID=208331 RepID=A0ABU7DQA2_9TELE|nr:hypothetical protein [Characodon lateralis]